VRWHAAEGDTPGFDISYAGDDATIAVEVKGSTARAISTFELTEGELDAAKRLGQHYHLYLVAECGSSTPTIQIIPNPLPFFESQGLLPRPVLFRIGA
jgi:hypothetical protein